MSMQMLVRGYLAFHLTGDFRALGLVSIGSALPMLLLSPLGGVIADRTSRRAVLQIGQMFSLGIAVVVAFLLFAGMLDFWHLVAASVAQGIMMALVMPSRQAFLPEVVGMGRLMNAIPLQSAGMNLMQLIAPAIGGFMIDLIGPGSVYSVMAVMYAFSVVALFGVHSMSSEDLEASRSELGAEAGARSGARGGGGPRGSALSELGGGLRYIFRDRTILAIVSLSFLTSILAMPIRMLLPGYVAEVFDDSGATLGLLQASMAIGALIGALVLATMRSRQRRGLLFAGSAVLMGVAMLGFSTTGTFIAGATGLFVIGIGSAGRQSMSQLLVQEYVHDEYRGRVMAVFMMQFSLMSVGVLGVAILMQAVGAQFAIMLLGGLLVAAVFLYLLLVPRLRRLA
jgi:MFS family permease